MRAADSNEQGHGTGHSFCCGHGHRGSAGGPDPQRALLASRFEYTVSSTALQDHAPWSFAPPLVSAGLPSMLSFEGRGCGSMCRNQAPLGRASPSRQPDDARFAGHAHLLGRARRLFLGSPRGFGSDPGDPDHQSPGFPGNDGGPAPVVLPPREPSPPRHTAVRDPAGDPLSGRHPVRSSPVERIGAPPARSRDLRIGANHIEQQWLGLVIHRIYGHGCLLSETANLDGDTLAEE